MAFVSVSKPEAFLNACLQCNVNLEDHPIAPSKMRPDTSFLNKVMSQENMRHWDIEGSQCTFPGKGKIGEGNFPKVYVEYDAPNCDEDCDTAALDVCNSTPTAPDSQDYKRYKELQVNEYCGKSKRMTMDQLNNFCEAPADRQREELRRMAESVKRGINKQLLTNYVNGADPYPNGDSSITNTATVTVINTEGNIVPAGYAAITSAYRKNHYSGPLCNIGGTTLASYFDVRAYQGAGMNGTGTVDPFSNVQFSYDSYLDQQVQAVTGDTTASYGIVFPEGAFGMYTWNQFTGYREESFEDLLRTTLEIDGMTYDFFLMYDKKCSEWIWSIGLHWCTLCWDEADYCDSLGYKWLFKYQCGAFECDSLNIC